MPWAVTIERFTASDAAATTDGPAGGTPEAPDGSVRPEDAVAYLAALKNSGTVVPAKFIGGTPIAAGDSGPGPSNSAATAGAMWASVWPSRTCAMPWASTAASRS